MEVVVTATEPFAGWANINEKLTSLGPKRCLTLALRRVCDEMKTKKLRFDGDRVHNSISHTLLARTVVRMIADGSASAEPTTVEGLSATEGASLESILRQFNDLSQTPRNLQGSPRPGSAAARDRAAHALMFTATLSSQYHGRPMFDIARTWIILREYWPDIWETALSEFEELQHEPLRSAFQSLEIALLLHLGIFQKGGWILDLEEMLSGTTLAGQAALVIELYSARPTEAEEDWSGLEGFPEKSIVSPFLRHPIVCLQGTEVVAPDPVFLTTGIMQRLIRQVVESHAPSNRQAELVDILLGKVFERYVQRLLEACADESPTETFQNEFVYGSRGALRSPDGFLFGGSAILFESKSSPLPTKLLDDLSLNRLVEHLDRLTGKTERRRPLEQATRFLRAWRGGDKSITDIIGEQSDYSQVLYVVVSPDSVPIPAHWPDFRKRRWTRNFGPAEKSFARQTAFVSVTELELLACALSGARKVDQPTSFFTILTDWRGYWGKAGTDSLLDSKQRFRSGIGNYVMAEYPDFVEHVPKFLVDAFEACMSEVLSLFGAGS